MITDHSYSLKNLCLFLILPFLLSVWVLNKIEGFVKEAETQQNRRVLSRVARGMAYQASLEQDVKRRFNARKDNPAGIFLEHGRGAEIILSAETNRKEFEPFNFLLGFLQSGRDLSPLQLASLKNQLGLSFDPFRFRHLQGVPYRVIWGKKAGYLIWKRERASATQKRAVRLGLIIPPDDALRLGLVFHKFSATNTLAGAIVNTETKCFRRSGTMSRENLGTLLRKRKGTNQVFQDFVQNSGFLMNVEGPLWIYLEHPRTWKLQPPLWLGIQTLNVMVFFLIWWFFPVMQNRVHQLPLIPKFVGVFLSLLLFPAAAIGILAFELRENHHLSQKTETIKKARQYLIQLDDQYLEYERCFERFLQNFCQENAFKRGNQDEMLTLVKPLFRLRIMENIRISNFSRQNWFSRHSRSVPYRYGLAEKAIQKGSMDLLLGPLPRPISLKEAYIQGVVENSELGLGDLFRNARKLQLVFFGDVRKYSYVEGFPSGSGFSSMVIINISQAALVDRFIRHQQRASHPFRIFFRYRITESVFPKTTLNEPLSLMADEIRRTGTCSEEWLERGGKKFLVLGNPGSRLAEHDLFAIFPENLSRNAMTAKINYLGIGCFLAILVSLGCLLSLSQSFLTPLADVSAGIAAMKMPARNVRIPIRSDDELGKLATTFNRFLESLEEKETARVVQENLIPKVIPEVPGYDLAFCCGMTSHVGGDYLDCFPDARGNLVFLVGDVSGHGVSAALVMTMAKTVVFTHFHEQAPVDSLMERLNATLHQIFGRRQIMTFCLGILEPSSSRLQLWTIGNPYPLIFSRSSCKATFHGVPVLPLGAVAQRRFSSVEVALEDGDMVLFYTDGIVEPFNPHQQAFGYDRLQALLETHADAGPQIVIREIRDELRQHLQGNPLPDDFSLIALKKKVAGGGEA